MAFVVAALTTIGAGSAATGAAIAVAATGTVLSAYGQRQAGKAQEDQMKEQARQAKIAADGEELKRREELNRVLAANNAALAAGGIGMEGTPASIALSSAEDISLSEGMIGLSGRLSRSQMRRQGAMAAKMGRTAALSTTLQGVSSLLGAAGAGSPSGGSPSGGSSSGGGVGSLSTLKARGGILNI